MIRLLNISRYLPYRVESACQPRLPADRLHLPIRVIVEWKRNLGYLQEACDHLLHDDQSEALMSLMTLARLETVRLKNKAWSLEWVGPNPAPYSLLGEEYDWLDAYEQLLAGRLARLSEVS